MLKKRFIKTAKCLSAMAMALLLLCPVTGCNKKTENSDGSLSYSDYDVSILTLGKYKGVELEKNLTVSEAEIASAYYDDLNNIYSLNEFDKDGKLVTEVDVYKEYTALLIKDTVAAKNGDMVNIDYEGYTDGKKFDGGTATQQDLILGSKSFIDGFEEAIIGKIAGTEFDINVTFPEDYHSKDLAGKPAVFKIKLNYIYPALSEETTELLAKAYKLSSKNSAGDSFDESKFVPAYTNKDEYVAYTKKTIKSSKESAFNERLESSLLGKIYEDTKFKSYPENLMKKMQTTLENQASTYGVDVLTLTGYFYGIYTEEQLQEFKEYQVGIDCIIAAIVQKEKMTLSEDDFNAGAEKYAKEYNYESAEAFLAVVPRAELENMILGDRVTELIVDEANIVVVE